MGVDRSRVAVTHVLRSLFSDVLGGRGTWIVALVGALLSGMASVGLIWAQSHLSGLASAAHRKPPIVNIRELKVQFGYYGAVYQAALPALVGAIVFGAGEGRVGASSYLVVAISSDELRSPCGCGKYL